MPKIPVRVVAAKIPPTNHASLSLLMKVEWAPAGFPWRCKSNTKFKCSQLVRTLGAINQAEWGSGGVNRVTIEFNKSFFSISQTQN